MSADLRATSLCLAQDEPRVAFGKSQCRRLPSTTSDRWVWLVL